MLRIAAIRRLQRPGSAQPPLSLTCCAELRQWLGDRGTRAIIPNKSNRKQPFSFNNKSYKQRHRIENAFCRLKDFRRIATRYDRLARNFLAFVCLVAAIVWWTL